jgi:hypothetical protein
MIIYASADNGISGSWGFITKDRSEAYYYPVPVFSQQSYTKKKQSITRIDTNKLRVILAKHSYNNKMRVFIERPFVNPGGFKTSLSAVRALEATQIVVESLGLSYEFVDSRAWQREMLPKGLKGIELKKASKDIGIRLFPHLEEVIIKQKDADGLLIAEWARRNNL